MNKEQANLKKYAVAALGGLFVLLLLAVVFYKERLFFADASFVIFNVINSRHFFVLNSRYGSFITEVPLYIGTHLHLPIKLILIAYAISFNLFVFLVAAISVYRHKLYHFAILLVLYSFLFSSDSFFFLADTHIGIAWMFLFFSTIIYLKQKQVNVFIITIPFIALLFLAVTTHFIVIIPTVFLWVYLIANKRDWPFSVRQSICLSALFVAVIASKFLFVEQGSYDSNNLKGISSFSLTDVWDAFSKHEVVIFYYRCLLNYWWSVIIFIVSIVYLIKNKKLFLLFWVLSTVIGYLALMGLTYASYSDFPLCHIELEWIPLGIVVATPFVFECLPVINVKAGLLLLVLIFVTRLFYMHNSMTALKFREACKNNIFIEMKKKGINKIAFLERSDSRYKYIFTWGIPYETMLKSAMNKDMPQRTFCFINRDDKAALNNVKTRNGFWNTYGIVDPKDLNHEYFNIDTTTTYQVMEEDDLFK